MSKTINDVKCMINDFIPYNEDECIKCIEDLEHQLEQKEIKIRALIRICKKLYNNEELGTGVMNTLYSYGIIGDDSND